MAGIDYETVNNFFNFNTLLQQSSEFYSNLAMRHHYHQQPQQRHFRQRPLLGKACRRLELEESDLEEEEPGNVKGKTKTTEQLGIKIPEFKVACEEIYAHGDGSLEVGKTGGRSERKVNFAEPLSTLKPPTPRHSLDVLDFGCHFINLENDRTGFTSDSEEEGSDTDVLGDYFRHVQQGDIQLGYSKNQTDMMTNFNHARGIESYQLTTTSSSDKYQYQSPRDEDNDCYEMCLDEQAYEFINDIRLCGAAAAAEETGNMTQHKNNSVLTDMKFLYGDCGSPRILEMEEAVDQSFTCAIKYICNS